MREIKFRMFYENKYFYDIGVTQRGVIIYEHVGGLMKVPQEVGFVGIDCDDVCIEQFTGLHDKNGRDIYEGDIVMQTGWYSGDDEKCYLVRFGKGTFDCGVYDFIGWHCGTDHSAQDVLLDDGNYPILIVGNIHENPEMQYERG